MAKTTKIQWADATWNPFIGCTKVSPACDNCYAEAWARRCGRKFSKVVRSAGPTFRAPLAWKEPKRIFVCSLSDFFHNDILRADRHDAIHVMRTAPQHTYMLLTKRPENIKAQLAGTVWAAGLPDNVWLGVTVENQEQADKRIPILLESQAKVRFISCEPLLGPVDILGYVGATWGQLNTGKFLHWVIAGGESGFDARPMHPAWARSLRDQCAAAGIPFMFKQWGEYAPSPDGGLPDYLPSSAGYYFEIPPYLSKVGRFGKKQAGRRLDRREHNGVPA